MDLTAAAAVGLALALDATVEEFPGRVHPVALFGRVVARVDRAWERSRLAGALATLVLPLVAAAAAAAPVAVAAEVGPVGGAVTAGLVLFATTSLRMLLGVAREVIEESAADPAAARESVRALVGRDPSELSPAELRGAAVESAAENLADGLVAPLVAFVLGAVVSLPAAAGAAAWVKAVNTMDSMLGYPAKPVGRASANLDDAVMWLPARLSAALLATTGRSPGAPGRARTWADAPPSPNSGWPMATLAAVLDVELRKPGVYALNPGAGLPDVAAARRGVRVVGTAGLLAFLLAGGAALLAGGAVEGSLGEVVGWR